MKAFFGIFTIALFLTSCGQVEQGLPYYGHKDVLPSGDTLYHEVEPFIFTNQDGEKITEETVKGQVFVADYFFTHCPTMCPKMTAQMKRVRNAHPELMILTHTCDPERDTVERLKYYVDKKNIDTYKWHFVTGSRNALYEHGVYSYLVSTQEDVLAPGGFLHSPMFILVDQEMHIRGMYDGRDTEEVNKLIEDITKLQTDE